MPSADTASDEIATLRIELADTDPLIWRQLEVPTSMTLKALHETVQAAMGWCDQHLWELRDGDQRYGRRLPGDDWGELPVIEASAVRLRDVLKGRPRATLDYTYDFGDSWEHRLVFSHVRSGEPGADYPRYVGGERAAPPEDCGGIPGFYNSLYVLADPEHPEHEAVAEWFEGFDPAFIDVEVMGYALSRIARPRRSGRALAGKPKARRG